MSSVRSLPIRIAICRVPVHPSAAWPTVRPPPQPEPVRESRPAHRASSVARESGGLRSRAPRRPVSHPARTGAHARRQARRAPADDRIFLYSSIASGLHESIFSTTCSRRGGLSTARPARTHAVAARLALCATLRERLDWSSAGTDASSPGSPMNASSAASRCLLSTSAARGAPPWSLAQRQAQGCAQAGTHPSH
jgi:hypothetical protein